MRLFSYTLLLVVSVLSVHAQDVIYKKDDTKINCKVIEVGPESIKYSLADGSEPFIVLAKSEILVLQYANGEHEVFRTTSFQRDGGSGELDIARNTFSFNILDIVFLRLQMSYEHINKDGMVGFRFPLAIGMYENEPSFFTGFDLNFYPFGQKKASYFLGPKIRGGHINDYLFQDEDFIAVMFNNGVRVNVTSGFIISVNGSIGVVHSYNRGNTVPLPMLSVLMGFKI